MRFIRDANTILVFHSFLCFPSRDFSKNTARWRRQQSPTLHCVFLEGRGKNEHVQGGSDIQGCGCGLHRGGTGAAGLCSEEVVPRCDGRELQEPGLSGTSTLQTRYLTYRKRREALDDRDITPDGEKFR
ncbi:uncharacterized protein LOC114510829 isoform X2 [Phyllostomus discolor]|uniref:Uncharacterized protein LOC114510829 isoform X2 n=1 Tax=Phyllostomus discolor TaxID=89673 RepID=A0A7E6CS13_9CHIR|nr:uncharacterized protein LOC114510829 isoform X2 [Phyllostomus discolor]